MQTSSLSFSQRLNTGGANLSEQEIRNCVVISISEVAYHALLDIASNETYLSLTNIGEERCKRQYATELVVRFVVMRHFPYTVGMDLHEYLDKGIVSISRDNTFEWTREESIFERTVNQLNLAVGPSAFKKSNRFFLAIFEFVMNGASKTIERDGDLDPQWLREKTQSALIIPEMIQYSGSGVRGTQRLSGLVPVAGRHFS